jgi:F-type H+-transporting ATPase subunit delta
MGSATTQALAANADAVAAAPVGLDTARELFAASQAVSGSGALGGALVDSAATGEARAALVSRVFGSLSPVSQGLIAAAASRRWSKASDLVAGIEDMAIRAAAKAEPADVEAELFQVSRIVAANPELELALGSRLGDDAKKGELIGSLFSGRVSEGTALIVSSLVQQPRGRRVRSLLTRATRTVAAQRGRTVATVHTAKSLTAQQSERLTSALTRRYGGEVALNTVIDPEVLGGIRIQIADDVIDGSISSRLADLRQRLAG